MQDLLGLIALVLVAAATLGGPPWLARRVRRTGSGGSLMGPLEEIWAPATYRARIEVQTQIEREAPAPAPSDPRWPIDLKSR